MQNPKLYEFGTKDGGQGYNKLIFAKNIIRGFFDGFVIYLAVWEVLGRVYQLDVHHELGMWTAGMSTFCASCIVANVWLLMRFTEIDLIGVGSFALMIISTFGTYFLISVVPTFKNHDIHGDFYI